MKATSESFTAKESQADIPVRACEDRNVGPFGRNPNRAARLSKVIQTLMEILTDEDLENVAQVYRAALHANRRHWIDEGKDPKTGRARGHWEVIPDFKTRIAAANMIAAYREGLPVQRQLVIAKQFESAADVIASVKQSPELLKAVMSLQSQGIQIEADGQVIDIEREVQKTGSECEGDSTEKREA
jgi:hypothetical protein